MTEIRERVCDERRAALWAALLSWYDANKRDLPWRRSDDPYAVWISESMLQQTRVETVIPYFRRFMERFPTVGSLAEADVDEVLARWSGLGYYSRARRLHAAAAQLLELHEGEFPRDRAAAEALPGVGAYTAGAVLSIAYDLEEPLIDGNVQRVLARWFHVEGLVSRAATRRELEGLAEALVRGVGDPASWNQALMELGATICLPREPRCGGCPVEAFCEARAQGAEHAVPVLPRRPAPIDVELELFLVEEGGRVLLQRRGTGDRMAGLWELPTRELASGTPRLFPAELELTLLAREELGELRHTITRHKITAKVHKAVLGDSELPPRCAWFAGAELSGLGLTGMTKKALTLGRGRSL
ncbi:MAG: A/G-specific adenine glycosylase [Planctomycetes bacterium]|nr:A/G-specific adenine glycosylase [Planctomycetota bacterium]